MYLAWMEGAPCRQVGVDEFYPDKGESTRDAKAICNGDPVRGIPACPVKARCLDYALVNHERFGIWGGMSERERRKVGKAA